ARLIFSRRVVTMAYSRYSISTSFRRRALHMSKDVNDYLMRGIHGDKELRASEKIRYLGEFRERVLLALKQGQVRRTDIYPQVTDVIRRNPGTTMLLNGEMEYEAIAKYTKLAG